VEAAYGEEGAGAGKGSERELFDPDLRLGGGGGGFEGLLSAAVGWSVIGFVIWGIIGG